MTFRWFMIRVTSFDPKEKIIEEHLASLNVCFYSSAGETWYSNQEKISAVLTELFAAE